MLRPAVWTVRFSVAPDCRRRRQHIGERMCRIGRKRDSPLAASVGTFNVKFQFGAVVHDIRVCAGNVIALPNYARLEVTPRGIQRIAGQKERTPCLLLKRQRQICPCYVQFGVRADNHMLVRVAYGI